MKTALAIITLIILCGCQTFYSSVVTVTQVRDSAMGELAKLYKEGKISPETDKKISLLDKHYFEARNVLLFSLSVENSTNSTQQLSNLKAAVVPVLDILAPYVLKAVDSKNRNNLDKATQL